MYHEMRLQAYDEDSGEYRGEYVLYYAKDEWARFERAWAKWNNIELSLEESSGRREDERSPGTHFASSMSEGRKPSTGEATQVCAT